MNDQSLQRLKVRDASMKRVLFFRGKKVEDMNRQELISALTWSARKIDELLERHKKDLDTLAGLRKGLKPLDCVGVDPEKQSAGKADSRMYCKPKD